MREWLVGLVGSELADKALYLVVAAIVLLLLFSVIWVARKALGGSIGPRAKGRGPRLAVMDVTAIDPKRKLVLIRRDEVEHLLLVGGQNDVVVEAGILRIPASARAPRNDAALRSEPDMDEAPRQPVARATAPRAVLAPSRTSQMPGGGERQALPSSQATDNRAASPLARPVPRPAPAAVERPAPVAPAAAPPAKAEPVQERPPEIPQVRPTVRAVAQTPEPTRPDGILGSATEPVASLQGQEAVLPEAGPSAVPDAPAPPPLSPAPPAPRVSMDQDRRPAIDAKADASDAPKGSDARQEAPAPVATPQPAPPPPLPPLPLRQTISVTAAERPMQRVAIGGGVEPVRRTVPVPPAAPASAAPSTASRSMATPTYPAKPEVAGVEEQAATPSPVARGEDEIRSTASSFLAQDTTLSLATPEGPARESGELASGVSGNRASIASPIIAAAQRQQEMIRARNAAVPVRNVPPLPGGGGGGPLPPSDPGSRESEEEAAEKRPLSVRSFATTIQTRRPGFEPVVPVPLSAPPAPKDIDAAVTAPVPAITPPSEDRPAAGGPGSLEEVLSAELDSDLAGADWSPAGPEARTVQASVLLPDLQPAPVVKPETKEPWTLTLEEEMERLLGDFDFETSGSKKNG